MIIYVKSLRYAGFFILFGLFISKQNIVVHFLLIAFLMLQYFQAH
mgnify:CR=1 FL=1